MTDTLERLFSSTAALYARYDLDETSVPPAKRRRIFMEEVLELVEISTEVSPPQWDEPGEHGRGWVCDEAADVVVTVCGLLQAHGIPLAEFEAAIERVIAKNDVKVPPDYQLINGKITKASPAHVPDGQP